MTLSETIPGHDLKQRCDELKSQGAQLLSLSVGDTNSEWILEYWFDEVREEQPILL